MSNKSVLKIGDWVKGYSEDGELVIGYIKSLEKLEYGVVVSVVSSDHQETVGKTLLLPVKGIKSLPDVTIKNKHQILQLIDIALATGDEEWFLELSTQLNSMRALANNQ